MHPKAPEELAAAITHPAIDEPLYAQLCVCAAERPAAWPPYIPSW